MTSNSRSAWCMQCKRQSTGTASDVTCWRLDRGIKQCNRRDHLEPRGQGQDVEHSPDSGFGTVGVRAASVPAQPLTPYLRGCAAPEYYISSLFGRGNPAVLGEPFSDFGYTLCPHLQAELQIRVKPIDLRAELDRNFLVNELSKLSKD